MSLKFLTNWLIIFWKFTILTIKKNKDLFIDFIFWLWWVFIATCRLSPVVVKWSTASSCSPHMGFRSCGSGLYGAGWIVVVCRLNCSNACGPFLHQRSNQYPLHCQVEAQTTGPGGKPRSWLIIYGPKLDGAIPLESLHSECQTGILAS